jgi:putative transposase
LGDARSHADRAAARRAHDGSGTRQRPAPGLICFSYRGSQYASEAYDKEVVEMQARASMSPTACCYNNAPMESFFHTLKVELAHQRRWATREQARADLFAYIEG